MHSNNHELGVLAKGFTLKSQGTYFSLTYSISEWTVLGFTSDFDITSVNTGSNLSTIPTLGALWRENMNSCQQQILTNVIILYKSSYAIKSEQSSFQIHSMLLHQM